MNVWLAWMDARMFFVNAELQSIQHFEDGVWWSHDQDDYIKTLENLLETVHEWMK